MLRVLQGCTNPLVISLSPELSFRGRLISDTKGKISSLLLGSEELSLFSLRQHKGKERGKNKKKKKKLNHLQF